MKNSEKNKTPIAMMYCINDIKAHRFFAPFVVENDAVAIRHFRSMANDEESQFFHDPADFQLWRIGDFDPSDGQIDLLEEKAYLCDASALLIIDKDS